MIEKGLLLLENTGGCTIEVCEALGAGVLAFPKLSVLALAYSNAGDRTVEQEPLPYQPPAAESEAMNRDYTSLAEMFKPLKVKPSILNDIHSLPVLKQPRKYEHALAHKIRITPVKYYVEPPKPFDFASLPELKINYTGTEPYESAIAGMNDPARDSFVKIVLALNKVGFTPKVNSLYRSPEVQSYLKRTLKKVRVATPCMSGHQFGTDVDLDRKTLLKIKAMKLDSKHGFALINPAAESWHIEHETKLSRFSKSSLKKATKLCRDGKSAQQIYVALRKDWDKETVVDKAEKVFQGKRLPKGLAELMLRTESVYGNHMVSQTRCLGWYQFCPTTARSYKLRKPMNFKLSSEAAAKLAVDNKKSLRIYKIRPTVENLYFAHVIGPRNLRTLLRAVAKKNVSSKDQRRLYTALKSNWPKRWKSRKGNLRQDSSYWHTKFSTTFMY